MASQIWSDEEQSRINAGLDEYVKRASQIGAVAAVEYSDGWNRDLFTFVDDWNETILDQLFDIEDELYHKFDDVLFEFHVRSLDGEDLVPASRARIVYRRADDA
jgi:hypothetical protein